MNKGKLKRENVPWNMGHAVRPCGLGSGRFGISIKLHTPSLALSTILRLSTTVVELPTVGITLTTALLMLASVTVLTSVLIWASVGTIILHTYILYCIPIIKSRTTITLPMSVIWLKATIIISVTGKWDKIMSPTSSTILSKRFWRWHWAFFVSVVLLKWFTLEITWFVIFMGICPKFFWIPSLGRILSWRKWSTILVLLAKREGSRFILRLVLRPPIEEIRIQYSIKQLTWMYVSLLVKA